MRGRASALPLRMTTAARFARACVVLATLALNSLRSLFFLIPIILLKYNFYDKNHI